MYFTSIKQENGVYALGVVNLGQLISAAHVFKVFPAYYKVRCVYNIILNSAHLVCFLGIVLILRNNTRIDFERSTPGVCAACIRQPGSVAVPRPRVAGH
jgi:hypothetical protein